MTDPFDRLEETGPSVAGDQVQGLVSALSHGSGTEEAIETRERAAERLLTAVEADPTALEGYVLPLVVNLTYGSGSASAQVVRRNAAKVLLEVAETEPALFAGTVGYVVENLTFGTGSDSAMEVRTAAADLVRTLASQQPTLVEPHAERITYMLTYGTGSDTAMAVRTNAAEILATLDEQRSESPSATGSKRAEESEDGAATEQDTDRRAHSTATDPDRTYDVFLSHASEDKAAFVRPLAHELRDRGYDVWYDEFTLDVGDSLRRSINEGLARSKYGVVVLSEAFFDKEWTRRELDGLVALDIQDGTSILPVWYDIDAETVLAHSPPLADKFAVRSPNGSTDEAASALVGVLSGQDDGQGV